MPWFRVDDSFPDHPKVVAIPRVQRLAVVGLWTACGGWSAKQLTDGLIPADHVLDCGGKATQARLLVSVGLWHRPGETCDHARDECPGPPPPGHYQFHDWLNYQPSRESVMAEREAARTRMRKVRGAKPRPSDSGDVRPNVQANDPANVRANFALPRPGPARPDSPLLTLISRLAARGTRGTEPPPAEMVDEWQRIAGIGVDLDVEVRAYLARFGDQAPRDERGAWLGWLRKAAERHQAGQFDPDADIRPPVGCSTLGCAGGYLGFDDQERPIPCPSCRSHLRVVTAS
jgi:hypothetical protein